MDGRKLQGSIVHGLEGGVLLPKRPAKPSDMPRTDLIILIRTAERDPRMASGPLGSVDRNSQY